MKAGYITMMTAALQRRLEVVFILEDGAAVDSISLGSPVLNFANCKRQHDRLKI